MKKASTNQKLISIILTLTIIFVLVISGPASAVTLDITFDDNDLAEDTPISFLVNVDLNIGEHVPIQNLTVNITNSVNSSEAYVCVFDFDGSEITGCSDFSITKISGSGSYDSGFGYGYGFGGTFENRIFGYGYGLGYVGAGTEASYNITWSTPSVSASRNYNIEFYATADDGTNHYTYATMNAETVSVQNTEVVLDDDDYTPAYNNTEITVTEIVNATNITTPLGVTGVTLNLSSMLTSTANETSVYFNSSMRINATTEAGEILLEFPQNITLSSTTNWTGDFALPTVVAAPVTASSIADSGHTATIANSILIGNADEKIILNKAVRLYIKDRRSYNIGYYSDGIFTKITASCANDSQDAGDALEAGKDCRRNVGDDVVIWTKHFSTFVFYTQAAITSSSSSSSGGGSSGGSAGGFPSCTSDWDCTEWTVCNADGTRTRTCSDKNSCTGAIQPAVEETCTYEEPTQEEGTTEKETTEEEQKEESGMEETTGGATTETEEETEADVVESSGKGGFIWTLVILLVIIGGIIGYFMSNNVAYLNKRSERLHRLADENHAKGNVGKAQRMHEKAYKLQQKALDRKLR